ncbi:type I restriction-modification system DNA methylase subunit [Undibacterium sp. GrIS 1.8]
MPANLFYSTGIPVCILVLKKCKKPNNVLFINASGPENFEKGKRQNRLMDEHIAKIIDTYQFRKEEERYSKQVSMERIAEEGYNLNISRYISTGTPEKEIVLSDVNAELIDLERKIKEAKKRHNEFLKELEQLLLP